MKNFHFPHQFGPHSLCACQFSASVCTLHCICMCCVYIYVCIRSGRQPCCDVACGIWQLPVALPPSSLNRNGCQLTRFDFYNPRAACNAVKTNDKLKSIKLQLQRNGERSWGVVAGEGGEGAARVAGVLQRCFVVNVVVCCCRCCCYFCLYLRK